MDAPSLVEIQRRMQRLIGGVRDNIERVGWNATFVFPTAEQEGSPFIYTTGLTESFEHPELIVYGLGQEQGHGILVSCVERIRAGRPFAAGERRADVLEPVGNPLPVLAREHGSYPLNMARALYGRNVRALQIVWPDQEGRLPGDEGCDPVYAGAQEPLLEEEEGR